MRPGCAPRPCWPAIPAYAPTRPARGGAVRRTADVLLGAGVIAGTANLLNLLDLRPGRAIKAATIIGTPLRSGRGGALTAGTLGASAALLPADLDEEIMLGDAGANALGALLGVALAAKTGPTGRALALAVLAGLTAASEKVSFTKVIQDTPGLRELDALGRPPGLRAPRPAPARGSPAPPPSSPSSRSCPASRASDGCCVFLRTVGSGRAGERLQRRQHHPERRLRAGRGRRPGQPGGAADRRAVDAGDRERVSADRVGPAHLGAGPDGAARGTGRAARRADRRAVLDLRPDEQAVAARMLRIFAPQLPLYGIGIVLTGVLQAHHRFAWPVIAPLLSSVTVMGAYLSYALVDGARSGSPG